MDPLLREMHISLGCAPENLVLAGPPSGLSANVALLPEPADATHIATVTLTPTTQSRSPLFDAMASRHTNRGMTRRGPSPAGNSTRSAAWSTYPDGRRLVHRGRAETLVRRADRSGHRSHHRRPTTIRGRLPLVPHRLAGHPATQGRNHHRPVPGRRPRAAANRRWLDIAGRMPTRAAFSGSNTRCTPPGLIDHRRCCVADLGPRPAPRCVGRLICCRRARRRGGLDHLPRWSRRADGHPAGPSVLPLTCPAQRGLRVRHHGRSVGRSPVAGGQSQRLRLKMR